MINTKKRDRPVSDLVSPPHKMTKNQQPSNQPSNSDLMAQLNQLVLSNTDMLQKIDNLEKRFSLVEKLFGEVEMLKKEVERLSKQNKPNEEFRRFEIEQKQRSILVKGLQSRATRKYESRQETYDVVNEFFEHLGLNLTLQDYQRLGPLKAGETGSTLIRLQFWTKDDKAQLFGKMKEYSDDDVVKSISLINDYPLFQLADVKRLSNEGYQLRQKDKSLKTRIVPRGSEVRLQTRKGSTGKWTTVSLTQNRSDRAGPSGQADQSESSGQPELQAQVEA